MNKRLTYVAGRIGPTSVNLMAAAYARRFGRSEQALTDFEDVVVSQCCKGSRWNHAQVYVLAAHTFAPGAVDAFLRTVREYQSGAYTAEVRVVRLNGFVEPLGKVVLTDPEVYGPEHIGNGCDSTKDSIKFSDQHEWIDSRDYRTYEAALRLTPLDKLWPDKIIRLKKPVPRIMMVHPWGIGFGDLTFEVDFNRNDLHFQLHFGKRRDLCVSVAKPVFDALSDIMEATGATPEELDNENRSRAGRAPKGPNTCAWVLKWHLAKRNYDAETLMAMFASFVELLYQAVHPYVW